ncbi:etoposide-induced protein 2.4-domain-containing protein [Radiomyces spectabilis]|uniref:etoposide-induced protein 2.4-domain-containing protein n=1 Tax=Radiomyces spectabilis TaxID=64574 RepID=UPI00221FE973|nr:etoposide-induced protein 2.4-domain-containing protein [Radiomyces spectabilis]KAI8391328.1 etoposide-induced protein 2.4-domain-containing protein [Radiomyces spectabilis]
MELPAAHHGAFFLQGFVQALQWPTVLRLVLSSRTMQRAMLMTLILNGVVYFGMLLLLEMMYDSKTHHILGISYSKLTGYPMYLGCLLINGRYYSRVARATFHTHDQTSLDSTVDVASTIYVSIFYGSCTLFVTLLRLIPGLGDQFSFLASCLIMASYCFEYKGTFRGWTVEQRMTFAENHWAYFFGFGLPLTAMTFFLSTLRSGAVFALFYPSYIVMATTATVKPNHEPLAETLSSQLLFMLPYHFPFFMCIRKLMDCAIWTLRMAGVNGADSINARHKKSDSESQGTFIF